MAPPTVQRLLERIPQSSIESIVATAWDGCVLQCDPIPPPHRDSRGLCINIPRITAVLGGCLIDGPVEAVVPDSARLVFLEVDPEHTPINDFDPGILELNPRVRLVSEPEPGRASLELVRLTGAVSNGRFPPEVDTDFFPEVTAIGADARSMEAFIRLRDRIGSLPSRLLNRFARGLRLRWDDVLPDVLEELETRYSGEADRQTLRRIAGCPRVCDAVRDLLDFLSDDAARCLQTPITHQDQRFLLTQTLRLQEADQSDDEAVWQLATAESNGIEWLGLVITGPARKTTCHVDIQLDSERSREGFLSSNGGTRLFGPLPTTTALRIRIRGLPAAAKLHAGVYVLG